MCAEMINFWPFTDELRGSDSLKVATNEAFAVALTKDTFCVDPMLKKKHKKKKKIFASRKPNAM